MAKNDKIGKVSLTVKARLCIGLWKTVSKCWQHCLSEGCKKQHHLPGKTDRIAKASIVTVMKTDDHKMWWHVAVVSFPFLTILTFLFHWACLRLCRNTIKEGICNTRFAIEFCSRQTFFFYNHWFQFTFYINLFLFLCFSAHTYKMHFTPWS